MEKCHSAEHIVSKLRQADLALGKGMKGHEICRELGISQQRYEIRRDGPGGG